MRRSVLWEHFPDKDINAEEIADRVLILHPVEPAQDDLTTGTVSFGQEARQKLAILFAIPGGRLVRVLRRHLPVQEPVVDRCPQSHPVSIREIRRESLQIQVALL